MKTPSKGPGSNGDTVKTPVEQAAGDLFTFSIDREDVKALLGYLPETISVKPETVEYELHLLKIISVGWAITFYLEQNPLKTEIAEAFWKAVHAFSQSLSSTAELMVGKGIDYFSTLRSRLDQYVTALAEQPDAAEPAAVIGPEFAECCGNRDDVFVVMTGSRMFLLTIRSVKEYLESCRLR